MGYQNTIELQYIHRPQDRTSKHQSVISVHRKISLEADQL